MLFKIGAFQEVLEDLLLEALELGQLLWVVVLLILNVFLVVV
jgi:hypothetical protein